MNWQCQRAILCSLPWELSFLGVGAGAWRSALRCPSGRVQGWTQWMPCFGQPSSLAYAPLQLLISDPYSRHLFRPGTPDRQPMKPCVVFGTGGEGRTWEGDATVSHLGSGMRSVHGGPRPARGLVWKDGKQSRGPEAQAQPGARPQSCSQTCSCSSLDSCPPVRDSYLIKEHTAGKVRCRNIKHRPS